MKPKETLDKTMRVRPEALLSVVFLLGVSIGILLNEYLGSKSDCAKLEVLLSNNLEMVEDIQEAIRDYRTRRCRVLDIDKGNFKQPAPLTEEQKKFM